MTVTILAGKCSWEIQMSEPLIKTFEVNSGTNSSQTVHFEELKDLFESSYPFCQVANLRLVKILNTGETINFVDDQITIDSNFDITIPTSEVLDKTVLIEASTENLDSTTTLELIIYVTFPFNWPPMFSEDLHFDDIISIDDAQVLLNLPEIIDDNASSFKSIQILLPPLGSIVSSNETSDFKLETNKFLSYDFYENQITIDLPEIQLETFEGLHKIEIILTDDLGESKSYE